MLPYPSLPYPYTWPRVPVMDIPRSSARTQWGVLPLSHAAERLLRRLLHFIQGGPVRVGSASLESPSPSLPAGP